MYIHESSAVGRSPRACEGGRRIGLYKILFHFEVFVHEPIVR